MTQLDANGKPLDQIRLVGIEATGHHGVYEHERLQGQRFVADVVVHLDTRRAAAGDALEQTVHYGVLAEQVAAVLAGDPADLIETVAERIAATALAFPPVVAVDVSVHKPEAPITVPFADVVVTIHRDRTRLPAAEPWRPAPPVAAVAAATVPGLVREEPVEAEVAAPAAAAPGAATSAAAALVVPVPTAAVPAAPAPVVPVAPAAPPSVPVPPAATPAEPVAPATAVLPVAVEPPAPAPQAAVEHEAPAPDPLDVAPAEPVETVLAIGSNLGSPQDTLRRAVADLAATDGIEVLAVSPLARTAAVGNVDQPDFLNAVVVARTTLSPRGLLRVTQAIELRHGRERHEHWGPRTLDIDIVVHGTTLAVTEDLELPHPRAHERAFVLQPWAQVQPDAVLPGLGGGPVAALAATAPDRGGIRWLALDWLTAPVPAAAPDPALVGPDAAPQPDVVPAEPDAVPSFPGEVDVDRGPGHADRATRTWEDGHR